MNENIARFVIARPKLPAPPAVPNYVLRPGRWVFLQRLAFWTLKKLGRLFAKARAAEIDPAALPILRGSFQDIRATALWADLAAPAPPAGAAFPLAIDETC